MLRDSGAWEEGADYIIGIWHSMSEANRLHASIIKDRFGERNKKFDIINKGLYYSTDEFKEERQTFFQQSSSF